jgi:serine/threonine protein phosphatase 1
VLSAKSPRPRPSIPVGKRIYAVGDVHGRADLVSAVLTRIDDDLRASPIAESVLIFLGDYIDRGPQSRQVLDLLIARRRERGVVLLMGNHETYVSRFLTDPTVLSEWGKVGGIDTLLSYGVTPGRYNDAQSLHDVAIALHQAIPESHRFFFQSLALSFTCGDYFFTHAGVRPGIPLEEQSPQDLLWIRDEFLLHEEDFGKVVVHGHTPRQQPEFRPNRINIDTGAYATGRLTCLVLEGDQVSFV